MMKYVMTLSFMAAVGLSALFLQHLPYPYVWTFLLWAAVSLAWAIRSHQRTIRIIAVNLLLVALILAVFESLFWLQPDFGREKAVKRDIRNIGSFTNNYLTADADLGVRPQPDRVSRACKMLDDDVIYDVTYSIGPDQLRITPPPVDTNAPAVLLFGCSYTFGEGVNDEDCSAYRLAELGGQRFRIFNFGFHGYGPHHMLAALESGMAERTIGHSEPVVVIFQAIAYQAYRSSGKANWGKSGPWYELDEQEIVVRRGTFLDRDRLPPLLDRAMKQVKKSSIYTRLAPSDYEFDVTMDDVELMAAIIDKSRVLVEKKFPGASFHVLYWDEYLEEMEALKQRMKDRGLTVHLVSDFAPEIHSDAKTYRIANDWHPNEKSHELIAAYMAEHILPPPAE